MSKALISFRLAVDLIMLALFIICLAFRLTEEKTHEWTGMAFMLVFTVHTWLNFRWYMKLLNGSYSLRRIVNTMVNLALLGMMLLMAVGGMRNSRFVFDFLELKGGMEYRQWHTFASYWGLVLVGVHAGLHWAMIKGAIYKWFGKSFSRPAVRLILTLAGLSLAIFGVWSSFDREMGSKLFLGFGFDYWDPERPAALFYLCTFSLFWLYAFTACWFMAALEKIKALRPVQRPTGLMDGRS